MGTSGRAGVLAGVVRLALAPGWALDGRALFERALAREVEERRFFLWLPVAAMGGVALNLAADSEPALWAPAALTLVFSAIAILARSRPVALGVALALSVLEGDATVRERVLAPFRELISRAKAAGIRDAKRDRRSRR